MFAWLTRASWSRLRLGLVSLIIVLAATIPSTTMAHPSIAPRQQATEGLFQNDHFAMVYSGQWVFFSEAQASGGSFDYTSDEGASVSFQFNASAITIYRTVGPTRAIMRVLIDGVPIGQPEQDGLVDNYASTLKYAQPLRIINLTKAVHTITIEHSGTRNPSATNNLLDIDALEVRDVAPVEDGIYQNDDPAIVYNGTWTAYATASANGGSIHYTNETGATAQLVFTGGNAVRIGYTKDKALGSFDIYLDGQFQITIDCYKPTSQWQTYYQIAPIASDQTHVIEIRHNGQKNPNATGTWIFLDWIEVVAGWTPPPSTPVPSPLPADKDGDGNQSDPTEDRYEDTHASIAYFGEWGTYSNASASGGTVHYSSGFVGVDVASFVMQGGNAIEIGYTTAPYLGIFEVWVDGLKVATVDTYGPLVWKKTFTYYQVTPLQPHVIEIKATGQKNTYATGAWVYLDWVKMLINYSPTPPPVIPPVQSDDNRFENYLTSSWQYSGTWAEYVNTNASGINRKSVHYTNEIRAEARIPVEFSTTGTQRTIEFGYAQDAFMGIFEIYVDGELKATVDAYGPTSWQKTAMIYGGTSFSPGVHMVTIRNTGAKNAKATNTYVYVDWIRVYNDLAPPVPTPLPTPVGNGTYEDTSDHWWWEGMWTTYTTTGPSQDSVRYSNTAGSQANIRITNANAIRIGYATAPYMGIVQVYIDGNLAATIDGYSSALQWRKEWLITDLSTSVHHIIVRHTGTKNPAATQAWFYIDYITVIENYTPPTPTNTPAPVGPAKYENSHSAWVYHGWTLWSNSAASGGTAHYSTTAGDVAGITVTGGNGIELAYMEAKWAGIAEIYIDSVLVDTIDAYNSSDRWGVKRTYALSPSGQAHTLNVRITGRKNILATNTAFVIDYITVLTNYTPPAPTEIVYGQEGNRYETEDARVTLSRSWVAYNSSLASGGKIHYTDWSDATAAIAFDGLWVTIGYWTAKNYGMFDIYIDGNFVHRVDSYTLNNTTATYTARAPAWGQHILEIRTAGARNPASTGYFVTLDYFDVVDVVPTPVPTLPPPPTETPGCTLPGSLPDEANNTVFVGCYTTSGGDGSKAHPFPTISEALNTINDDWITARGITPGTPIYVYVMPGTYSLPNEFQHTGGAGSLTFNAPNIRLVSTGGREETVIDAIGLGMPAFDLGNYSNLVIDGFTIVRGDLDEPSKLGGGIYVHGGSVYIVNNEFWGNRGGAIGVTDAAAFIEGNLIHHNRASTSEGAVTFQNVLGGSYLRNNHIYENTQTAIRLNIVDDIEIARNFIYRNTPPDGVVSAIDADQFASANITNNVIYSNTSTGAGSATISIGENPVHLVNNTIANNNDVDTVLFTAPGTSVLLNNAITENGGTAIKGCTAYGVFLFNNNIWGNAVDYGTGCTAGTNNNISVDPYFYDPASGDYHIHVYGAGMMNKGRTDAPGLDTFAPERDYDDFWTGDTGLVPRTTPDPSTLGDERDLYGNPDIGADEVDYDPIAVTPTLTYTPVPSATPRGAQVGVYQEDHSLITYYGDWARYAASSALGGYANWTKQNGARFELEVATNKIVIYYASCSTCGSVRIRLDGNVVATLNTYSATTLYRQTYMLITTPGTHMLEITNMSTSWFGIDAIELANAEPIMPRTEAYDDDETDAFLFSAGWSLLNDSVNAYGGAIHYTSNTSARVTTYFYGRGFTLYYYGKDKWAGKFEIWIDGTLRATVDLYSLVAGYGYAGGGNTITFNNIGRSNHLLEIRHAGKNPASLNYYIYIDAIEILP